MNESAKMGRKKKKTEKKQKMPRKLRRRGAKKEPSSGTGEDKYLVPAPDGEDSLLKNLVDTCGSNEEKGARRGNNPSAKR